MNFCPNCGSVRGDKDICSCGYNYSSGEVIEDLSVDKDNLFNNEFFRNNMNFAPVSLEELKSNKKDYGDLLYVSYTSSGGMMGSYYNCELSFEKNEVTIISQEWHHAPRIKKIYKTDSDVVSAIKNILIENNFGAWGELPINNTMVIFDAPTSSMSLEFEKEFINISSKVYMSSEENQIYMDVKDKIYSFVSDDNLISEETLVEGTNLGLMNNFSQNTLDSSVSKRFCPECGSIIEDSSSECSCGYIFKED